MAVSYYEAFKALFSTIFLINTCTLGANVCNESLSTVQQVTFCPRNSIELQLAVKRKRCDALANIQTCVSEPNKFVYHCLVNQRNDGFVEVCAPEWILAGFCGYYDTVLDQITTNVDKDCTKFAYPCPVVFNSSDSYKYQGCYEVRKKVQEIQIGDEKGQAHPSASSSINHVLWIVPSMFAVGFFVAFIFACLKIRKMSFEADQVKANVRHLSQENKHIAESLNVDTDQVKAYERHLCQEDKHIAESLNVETGYTLEKTTNSTPNRKPVESTSSDSISNHKVTHGRSTLNHSTSDTGYPSKGRTKQCGLYSYIKKTSTGSEYRVGPCFTQLSDSMCQGHPTGLVCTTNLCCATVGNACGYPSEQCPVPHFPCRCRITPCHKTMSCQDMNEFIDIPRVCGGGTCVNSVGSHSCECKGKRQNQITQDCEDWNADTEGDPSEYCEKDAFINQK